MITLNENAKGLSFNIYVLPRTSKAAIVGCHQEALKIKLTAPPIDGSANKQCIQVLAKALAIPKSAIAITCGQKSRRKSVCIALPPSHGPEAMQRLKKKLVKLGSA